jgi:hypothetical protein
MSKAFEKHLDTEVKRIAKREGISESAAFLFWCAINILELADDEAREAISIEGANDKGIDLFWVDENEGRVVLAQGKYSRDFSFHPKQAQVAKLESSLNWLINPEALRRDGKPDLAQAAEDYLQAVQNAYGVELWFLYTGPKCPNIEKHIGVFNQNPEHVQKRRAMRHYHIEMLRATWEELEGSSRRIEAEKVAILEGKGLAVNGPFGKAYVATIPAQEIVRLYKKYEEHLFDRNVRLFLGVRKGSVNAGIAETLNDEAGRGNFWAYNNGMTFVCDDFTPSSKIVQLKNFSIVNGCQTAVSLAQGPEDKLVDVSVLARFIAASPGIVDDVIRYTNSQNPIRTWDIASQDKTQRRLKTEFAKLAKPYIYMTRRGSRPEGDLGQFREDGKLRQIRIDIIGQYAAAFRGDPVLAYKYKALIFSKDLDNVFPPDVRVEEVLFQWTCGEICKAVVKARIAGLNMTEARIVKKGGTLFLVAAMSRILALRNGATYLTNMSEAAITSKGAFTRLTKYAEYAMDKYVQAVLDQSGIEQQELTTLVRSREFYQKVIDRIERGYSTDARGTKWLNEALPKIG